MNKRNKIQEVNESPFEKYQEEINYDIILEGTIPYDITGIEDSPEPALEQIQDGEEQIFKQLESDMSNEDYLEPAKAIYNFSKNNDYYKIKGGVIEGKVMTAEEIITLAKLPSRETLLSMLAGALLGNISKVAVALDQVRIKKEAGAETVEAPAEA